MTQLFDCVLVSCAASKRDHQTAAKDLYVSDWFLKARRIAEEYGKQWFILSAKHGLLSPNTQLKPYDQFLDDMSADERRMWGLSVWESLKGNLSTASKGFSVLLLAGQSYRKQISPHLLSHGISIVAPLSDLGIGRQLKYLNAVAGMSERVLNQRKFYEQLARLRPPGSDFVRLKDLRLSDVPSRGVYFFMDDGEYCRLQPNTRRIVRIGTHAVSQGSKSTLWQRLRAHRGLDKGGGSHRSSIFRLHVGNCVKKRDGIALQTWALGDSATRETRETENHMENLVSEYIGRLRVAILPIHDHPGPDSDRSFIEMNAIGLLTEATIVDAPSNSWLGKYSPVKEIAMSGLWNINYVGLQCHPRFLEILERIIDQSLKPDLSPISIAPTAWRMNKFSIRQIQLFEEQ